MADGRLFNDYRSGDIRDNIVSAGFVNANEYRHFLQNNADEIMSVSAERVAATECGSCDLRSSPVSNDKVAMKPTGLTLESDTKRENFSVVVSNETGALGTIVAVGVVGLLYALYYKK
jgi:hypothetical protein